MREQQNSPRRAQGPVLCRRHRQEESLPSVPKAEAEKQAGARRRWRSHRLSNPAALCFLVLTLAVFFGAAFWLPVLQVHGGAMSPALEDGELVLAVKCRSARRGDLLAFRHNDKILIRRVIAKGGDLVEVSPLGEVTVNGQPLDEPYLSEKALGSADVTFPYRVPKDRFFLLADDRLRGIDSRNSAVGCVAKEQFVGRIFLRIWPMGHKNASLAP